ncbi:MAG TPA: flagellin [Acetobacteraceae bacterium]|jgi:flagellin|nr:flagellin [Acetobacteraceae bacterium]
MSLNSVNTNMGAMIALESLNRTNADLAATQKRVSTGSRVADATDDGAAYAVAQSVRSTVGALGAANQQLGNLQGLLSTTQSGLNDVSNTMASMRDVLVKLSDSNVAGNQRTQYQAQYSSLLANVKSFIQDANYNGKTLIGNIAGSSGTFARVSTVRNESGASYGIATYGASAMYNAIAFSFGATIGAAPAIGSHASGNTVAGASNVAIPAHGTAASYGSSTVAAMLTVGGTFIKQMNAVGSALNTIGSEVNYVNNQVSYNNDKIDALNTGLGSLVDADLAKESAQLQALQIRQQLGTQALSLANQAPQTLLSLFK